MAVLCMCAHACSHFACVVGWMSQLYLCMRAYIYLFAFAHAYVFTLYFSVISSGCACKCVHVLCVCVGSRSRNARRSVCKGYITVCFSEQPLTTLHSTHPSRSVPLPSAHTSQSTDPSMANIRWNEVGKWSHSGLQHSCDHLWVIE